MSNENFAQKGEKVDFENKKVPNRHFSTRLGFPYLHDQWCMV